MLAMDVDHSLAPVVLDGESLTIEKVVNVARYNAPVELSESCYEGIDRARALVEKILREDRRVYGISTGFGEFSVGLVQQEDHLDAALHELVDGQLGRRRLPVF